MVLSVGPKVFKGSTDRIGCTFLASKRDVLTRLKVLQLNGQDTEFIPVLDIQRSYSGRGVATILIST